MSRIATVTAEKLNMRQEPNASSKIKGTLKKGDRITIFDNKNGWAKSYGYWVSESYLEYVDTPQTTKPTYIYNSGCHIIKCSPNDLKLLINERQTLHSVKEKNLINATYFWYLDKKKSRTYPTSILYADGKVYQGNANHIPSPQSVFVIYKNGLCEILRIKRLADLPLSGIRMAIGGLGIKGTGYNCSPATEGFTGPYSDVIRTTNKTFIGYSKKENKLYLICKTKCSHSEATQLPYLLGMDMLLQLDAGGSSCIRFDGRNYVSTDGRLINNFLYV